MRAQLGQSLDKRFEKTKRASLIPSGKSQRRLWSTFSCSDCFLTHLVLPTAALPGLPLGSVNNCLFSVSHLLICRPHHPWIIIKSTLKKHISWPHHSASGILVPRPGIEPATPGLPGKSHDLPFKAGCSASLPSEGTQPAASTKHHTTGYTFSWLSPPDEADSEFLTNRSRNGGGWLFAALRLNSRITCYTAKHSFSFIFF